MTVSAVLFGHILHRNHLTRNFNGGLYSLVFVCAYVGCLGYFVKTQYENILDQERSLDFNTDQSEDTKEYTETTAPD
eukprot:CAMPEP_0116889562 /NCGR_PEP_ID=MMETSP0467-20121206/101_1 /TAXON_ID=283647 /ORGANISM="Mesodinium pulex, Strain SPMC105" /LENGTH=76 /DNA_ID=CAMNT_0004556447 /DNA_START=557 /DNA_END=787 /DNA_ORIENTATION=+